ncbi:MAG: hypothetical protein AAGA62_08140, partial [Bacteroidota bacterium]
FADGDYFTFAQEPPPVPGGVGPDLTLWLRADLGVTRDAGTATAWSDQGPSAFLTEQSGTVALPLYETANPNFNFNPSIDFTASTTRLSAFNTGDIVGENGIDDYTMLFVGTTEGSGQAFFSFQADVNNQHYGAFAGNAGRRPCRANYNSAGDVPVPDRAHLLGVSNGTAGSLNGYENAVINPETCRNTNVGSITRGELRIGGGDGFNFQGHLAEVVVYDQLKSATEIQQIRSYLAVKYGITLSEDYLSSLGTPTWTNGGGYDNAITGIGRDDITGLYQRQSRSQEPEGLITMGLGTIAATNADNPNSFDNGSFLLFGDDGAAMAWTGVGAPSSPSTQYEVLGRTFMVEETGTVGAVTLSVSDPSSTTYLGKLIDRAATKLHLVVDGDTDFSDATTIIDMTLVGTEWVADEAVDFTDGQFFTIARSPDINAMATSTQVSCVGAIPNADASIMIDGMVGDFARVAYSPGTSFAGDIFADADVVAGLPYTLVDTISNKDMLTYYTVRTYISENLFEDYVVPLERRICATATLEVAISPLASDANAGEILTYTVTVTNAGPDTAEGVEIKVDIPPTLEYLTASGTNGAYNSLTKLWKIENIPLNGVETLTIKYMMK